MTPPGFLLAPAPGPDHGPGTGANTQAAHLFAPGSAFARARDGYWTTRDGQHVAASSVDPHAYDAWLDHIWPAAGCTHPIRLGGQIHRRRPRHRRSHLDAPGLGAAGRDHLQSLRQPPHLRLPLLRRDLPPGRLPAHPRRADRRQRHPRRTSPPTRPCSPPSPPPPSAPSTRGPSGCTPAPINRPARARRNRAMPAVTLRSARTAGRWPASPGTARDDPALGQPLCPDCYDHAGHVVWNNTAGELWRRTKQAIERHLNQLARHRHLLYAVRVSHGKAAEYQARGAVHFARPAPPRRPRPPPTPRGCCPRLPV